MFKETDIINAYKQFKKTNLQRKKIQIAENVYVDFKRGKKDITGSLFLRGTYIKKYFNKNVLTIDKIEFFYDKNKNLKIKNFDKLVKNVKKIKEKINELKNNSINNSIIKLNEIEKYKEEFFKDLEKRKIKKETIERYKKKFEKNLITFFKNKNLNLIKIEDLVDFCNYILQNLEYRGAATLRKKEGCSSLRENLTVLKLFYSFLLSKNAIKEENINVVENFNYKKYFNFCKKQGKSIALQHFKTLEEVRDFYSLLQEIKQQIEKYFEGNVDEEYLAELLNYKNKKLLNANRLNSFLHRVLITEFIMLTGIRGTDFFKIKENAIKNENNISYIYFKTTKNDEEYTLYLTDYLLKLYIEILNTKGDCYRAKNRKKYLTCLTHQSFRNFVNSFFINYHKININIHGFRHTLKTFAEEYLNFPTTVIELQLGHKVKGVEGHYLQGDLKHKRLELLEKYRTLLSKQEYCYIYDRQDTLKKEIFKFLEEMNVKYSASIQEIEDIIKKIKVNSFENVGKQENNNKEEIIKNFLDNI